MNIADNILSWYYKNNQKYPWRNTANPYFIWISEIMLQQTQANTACLYYDKWVKKFPTIKSVANSSLNEILKAWEGLGYYARARNFYTACQILTKKKKNTVPKKYDDFIQLPGVGEYTASAVLSIAYNQQYPAIDVNVVRIISRIYEISAVYPKSKLTIQKYLEKIIPNKYPGDFNQAMMDFGRFICTSLSPKCHICIIKKNCTAYVNNTVNMYPKKLTKKKGPHYNIAVGVIWKKNKILITKRPQNGLLGGLWEFPGGKIEKYESPKQCVKREIKEELNINIEVNKKIKKIKHVYSHFSITMTAYSCQYIDGAPKLNSADEFKWIGPKNINNFPFPRASHKIFDSIYDKTNY